MNYEPLSMTIPPFGEKYVQMSHCVLIKVKFVSLNGFCTKRTCFVDSPRTSIL